AVSVAQPHPADVTNLAAAQVQSAEDQTLVLGVQLPQPPGGVVHHGVALHERAGRAATGEPVPLPLGLLRLGPQHRNAVVDPVDVTLLRGDLPPTYVVGHVLVT